MGTNERRSSGSGSVCLSVGACLLGGGCCVFFRSGILGIEMHSFVENPSADRPPDFTLAPSDLFSLFLLNLFPSCLFPDDGREREVLNRVGKLASKG